MKTGLFHDRRDAGRKLAAKLSSYANRPALLVLALPRGGVPVAYEVARALGVPLDVLVVRKLGVPGYEELAMPLEPPPPHIRHIITRQGQCIDPFHQLHLKNNET